MGDKRKYSGECFAEMKRYKSESLSDNIFCIQDDFIVEQIKLHHSYLHDIGLRISSMMDSLQYHDLCNYEQGIKLLCMGIDQKMKEIQSIQFSLKGQINQLKETALEMLDLIEYLKTYVLRVKS